MPRLKFQFASGLSVVSLRQQSAFLRPANFALSPVVHIKGDAPFIVLAVKEGSLAGDFS